MQLSCSFESNEAKKGGAIALQNNVALTQAAGGRVTFSGNKATSTTSGDGGGAIYMVQTKPAPVSQVKATFSNVNFTQNTAGAVDGGAVLVLSGQLSILSADLSNPSIFKGNSAGDNGGAVRMEVAPSTPAIDPSVTFTDVVFDGNVAGGALHQGGGALHRRRCVTPRSSKQSRPWHFKVQFQGQSGCCWEWWCNINQGPSDTGCMHLRRQQCQLIWWCN